MDYIKQVRKQRKLTLEYLGDSSNIPRQRLSQFEKGKDCLTFGEVVTLCKKLNLRVTISEEATTFDCK